VKRLWGLLPILLVFVFQGAAQSDPPTTGEGADTILEESGAGDTAADTEETPADTVNTGDAPAKAAAPEDSPASAEAAASEETAASEEAATPEDSPVPVEAATLEDTPASAETAAPMEAAAQAEVRDGPERPGIRLFPAAGHSGPVNAMRYDGDRDLILSAGADGFLGIWNVRNNRAEERFQVSSYSLLSMALRPGKTQIALIESDGLGSYRISAWDYLAKKNLFILRFRDPLSYITYSGSGNFLIVSRSARTGVVFVDPETGEPLQSPEDLSGLVSFAATGRSERTMISYSPTGVLSYWELETGVEIRHFLVPPGINSPILFGNNRFFAGIDHGGLVILDAVSGKEIIRDSRITQGLLFPVDAGEGEFLYINPGNNPPQFSRYTISNTGRLETRERRNLTGNVPRITSLAAAGSAVALGTTGGSVFSLGRNGNFRVMAAAKRLRVNEVGASGGILAFIGENNTAGFIPLDFGRIRNNDVIALERNEHFTHIETAPDGSATPNPSGAAFLFWQSDSTRHFPVLRRIPADGMADNPGANTPPPGTAGIRTALAGSTRLVLDKLPMASPLRSVSMLEGGILFLDSAGAVRVLSAETGEGVFSFSSAGSLDAAFLDRDNIVIGRSAVSGNTPFLRVAIATGETVPLPYPASIGARIYRGASGALYGAAIDGSSSTAKTSILRIDPRQPAASVRLVEYQGEDTGFGLAECGGALASTIGGDGASLYSPRGVIPFDRSPGLPLRLINGGGYFVTIDADGNISWHANQTGELRALLQLYENTWVMEQYNRGTSTTLSGRLTGAR
jgi:WD40 repeat protein